MKLAELTSGVGALVLGVGLGSLFPQLFGSGALLVVVTGVVLHGLGMWDKHRLETVAVADSEMWVTGLYWVCWVLLVALLLFLFI